MPRQKQSSTVVTMYLEMIAKVDREEQLIQVAVGSSFELVTELCHKVLPWLRKVPPHGFTCLFILLPF